MIKTTVAFMQAHPDEKQYRFASVIMAAVRDRWPCH
ncbi:Rap1a/Tai family immunity protein [Bradyrhizobium monzae]